MSWDLDDWLHNERIYPPTDDHPSKYGDRKGIRSEKTGYT